MQAATTISQARVTIVMTARERHALTEAALESIVAETPQPYRLVYVDLQGPAWLRETLARRAREWQLEIVHHDEPLWPQQARARIAPTLTSEYVVFIDNDVQVQPGWLDALVRCADETGAGAVGPLYLWGDGIEAPRIHMAGGRLSESSEDGRRVLGEAHHLIDRDPADPTLALVRERCDFLEFHCMLVRGELLRDGSLLDPRIVAMHEHVDACLTLRERGHAVYFEPASCVTYLAFADYLLDDLPYFRRRWASDAVEHSLAAFAQKWNVIDDARSFGVARVFSAAHLEEVDPVCGHGSGPEDLALPMRREELRQTRSDLLDLALARGYNKGELATIASACQLAQLLMDGAYRPCGRPFINHLCGTASVLLRYDFKAEVVAAALLHAVYSHCPEHPGGRRAGLAAVAMGLGGRDGQLERRVRAYSQRDCAARPVLRIAEPGEIFISDAETIALAGANELDMHLSGEFRYTGRSDALDEAQLRTLEHVCAVLGVPGLACALREARAQSIPARDGLATNMLVSYRISADKERAIPIPVTPPELLDEGA